MLKFNLPSYFTAWQRRLFLFKDEKLKFFFLVFKSKYNYYYWICRNEIMFLDSILIGKGKVVNTLNLFTKGGFPI